MRVDAIVDGDEVCDYDVGFLVGIDNSRPQFILGASGAGCFLQD